MRISLSRGLDSGPGELDAELFEYSLDWLLEAHRRYGEPVFSLICLRLSNMPQVAAVLGEAQGQALVDSLLVRFVDSVRAADRCTQTGDDTLWLLLPYTDGEARMKVEQRLRRLSDLFEGQSAAIGLQLAGVTAPMDLRMHEDASVLMERVASKLS